MNQTGFPRDNNFLLDVINLTWERVRRAEEELPLDRLLMVCMDIPAPPSFTRALRDGRHEGLKVIAEVKAASPSQGELVKDLRLEERVVAYERGGAAALSILTEPFFFGGDLDFISRAKKVTSLPILRKDFILSPYQVCEARARGASSVLLITRVLEASVLRELIALSRRLQMESLVEIHDEEDLEKAMRAGAHIIGINNRDLETLEVNLEITERLAPLIPTPLIRVSESGIKNIQDVKRLKGLQLDALLVGETLMRSDDPAALLSALVKEEGA